MFICFNDEFFKNGKNGKKMIYFFKTHLAIAYSKIGF